MVRQQARPSLKAVAGVVALLLVGFSLLPVPLQKRFYGFLRGTPVSIERIDPVPVAYDYISSAFGKRWGRQHQGIDFAAPHGAPIYAMSAGTVVYSGWESGYGKSVVIDHGNGTQTRYAHCSKLLVKTGKVVSKGQKIAKIGSTGHSTGPHLHFEVIVKGVRKNPAWYYAFATSDEAAVAQAKP
jgi:murein DD-endopeptidase MepM/ murein hydrolase activator NlpD